MLDIKYFKQIDEVLEVDGYKYAIVNNMPSLIFPDKEFEYIDTFGTEIVNYGYHHRYELYLVRVIEAINRKYNDDNSNFFIRVLQEDDTIRVNHIAEIWEIFDCRGSFDTAKELAITYVMDHIKEKV